MNRTIHLIPFVAVIASVCLWHLSEPATTVWEYHATTLWSWLTIHEKPLPEDERWLGIYRPEAPYSVDEIEALSQRSGVRFRILSIYQAWGNDSASQFPLAELDAVHRYEAIPMVTWEPWLSGFISPDEKRSDAERRSLRRIARGEFDDYVRRWAREAFEWGKPMFLRFAHEMDNAEQYPWTVREENTPQDFIDAWKRVRRIFDDEGTTNVSWVWSPRDAGADRFWPGADVVDWTSVTVFNYGAYHTEPWMPFQQIYAPKYAMLIALEKPIMIGELGCVSYGGDKAEWYREAWRALDNKFSETKAVVLFQHPADKTSGAIIDWTVESVKK